MAFVILITYSDLCVFACVRACVCVAVGQFEAMLRRKQQLQYEGFASPWGVDRTGAEALKTSGKIW